MNKSLRVFSVLLIVSFVQSSFAFDTMSEIRHAFSKCERSDIMPLLDSTRIFEQWGSGYEGSGCETTIFSTKKDGQDVYISAYVCGESDEEHVADMDLRFTSGPTEPRKNERTPFFSSNVYKGVQNCN